MVKKFVNRDREVHAENKDNTTVETGQGMSQNIPHRITRYKHIQRENIQVGC